MEGVNLDKKNLVTPTQTFLVYVVRTFMQLIAQYSVL